MRWGLFLLVMLSAGAFAKDTSRPAPTTIDRPGYTAAGPGAGWTQTESINGGPGPLETWTFVREGAKLEVQPITWHTDHPTLEEYARVNAEPHPYREEFKTRDTQVTAETIAGASCAAAKTIQSTADASPLTQIYVLQVCTHPQMPALAVEVRTELVTGAPRPDLEAEMQAVAASLRFKPIPVPFHAYRPGCAVNALIAAEGAMWASCDEGHSSDQKGYLLRIDPALGAMTRAAVGHQARSLGAAGGYIWIASLYDSTVSRFDPRSNTVTATLWFPGMPTQLLTAGGSLWVGTDDFTARSTTFTEIDPATAAIVRNVRLGDDVFGIGAGDVLLLKGLKRSDAFLLDGKTGKIGRGLPSFSPTMAPRHYDGRTAWVVDNKARGINAPTDVFTFDPKTPDVAPVLVRHVEDDVADADVWNGSLCALSHAAVTCFKDDARLEIPLPARNPSHLIVFAGSLWIDDYAGRTIVRIDPK